MNAAAQVISRKKPIFLFLGIAREVINGKKTAFCCKRCANSYKKKENATLEPPFLGKKMFDEIGMREVALWKSMVMDNGN